MSEVSSFMGLLTQRIKELLPVQTDWMVVKSVDWEKRTMVATGVVDELDIDGILLGLGSQYRRPAVGTRCLVGTIQNNGAMAFLIEAEAVEEFVYIDKTGFELCLKDGQMTINGDDLGGLIKVPELRAQLDKNTAILQAIQQAFQNWAPVSGDGGQALKTLAATFVGMDRANLSNIENEKVKHGSAT